MSQHHGRQRDYQPTGPIVRGLGRPRDLAGHQGNVYIDTNTNYAYIRRNKHGIYGWGQWQFEIAPYSTITLLGQIKWYSDGAPSNDLGADGDYAMVWGPENFGLIPTIWGPRTSGLWFEYGQGAPIPFTFPTTITLLGVGAELDNQPTTINTSPVAYLGLGSQVAGYPAYITAVVPIGLPSNGQYPSTWTENSSVDTGPADTPD